MKSTLTLLLSFICFFGHAQENFNLELVANVDVSDAVNDIWGYVAPDGMEYAIMTSGDYTRIYSLEDPTEPRELIAIIGNLNSTHRDIKSNGEYLYVTCDQGQDGLLIIDMTDIDEIKHVFWRPQLVVDGLGTTLSSCHNLYIDENGVCYLAGCQAQGRGGVIMLDITTDPMEPSMLGYVQERYSHDVYARGDTLYSSEINNGVLSIYDVSDKENYALIGQTSTSFDFTHNAWLSDDGRYVYTTDERENAFVDSYDISDLDDIKRLDVFQPLESAGNGVIPHNTHFMDDYLITSWYTDGVVITDVSDPSNIVKVGSYDTFLGAHGNYNGCWGAYPWLPSGLVLASDRQTGLYVLRPNYVRASFLHGMLTDAGDGSTINNVSVEIQASQMNASNTNAMGNYKTGVAMAGTYDVIFSHSDYQSKTLSATITSGEITILDAQLEKLKTFNLSGNVVSDVDGNPIENAKLRFYNNERTLEFKTDANGNFDAELFEEKYTVVVGAWGYKHLSVTEIDPANPGDLSYRLPKGYMDDFVLDLEWEVTSNATTGIWTRESPIATFNNNGSLSNIGLDNQEDLGEECYMTGNGGGGPGDDDVDDGVTQLLSPSMDLSDMTNPVIQFEYYFANSGGFGNPNDQLEVYLIGDGGIAVLVETITASIPDWSPVQEIKVKDYLLDLSDVSITFVASDDDPGHLVEAAIDVFRVVEGVISATNEILASEISLTPNPFVSTSLLEWKENFENIEIYNLQGLLVYSARLEGKSKRIGDGLNSGIYFVSLYNEQGNYSIIKMIKK